MIFSERPLVVTGYKDAYMPSYAGEGGGGGAGLIGHLLLLIMSIENWTERLSNISTRSVHLCKICLGFENSI